MFLPALQWRVETIDAAGSLKRDPLFEVVWSDPAEAVVLLKKISGELDFAIEFPNLAAAHLDFYHEVVRLAPIEGLPEETIQHLLADQVAPRVLAHQGEFVLHAGAVEHEGGSVLFLGPSGRGKSTLVASLQAAGWGLLGDDAVIVDGSTGTWRAKSLYPSLRLLPDSIKALYPDPPALAYVAHYSWKQRVALQATEMEPIDVRAIFVLSPESAPRYPSLRRMRPAEACMALIENSFALDPTDVKRAQRKLDLGTSLATSVSAYELAYPRDYAVLPAVRALLEREMRALTPLTSHEPEIET